MNARDVAIDKATKKDVRALATMMARAFIDDPPCVWILPSSATRERRLRKFFATCLRRDALVGGVVDVAVIGTEIVGVAIWYPPGAWPPPLRRQLACLGGYGIAFGRRLGAAAAIVQAMANDHMRSPHWYLAYVAVDPTQQGKSAGSVLLRSRLDECDAVHVDQYLESSKVTNVPLFQHFGFETLGEVAVPPGAPVLTRMRRVAPAP